MNKIKKIFHNYLWLNEILAIKIQQKRRLSKLTKTAANNLKLGQINSLELLDLINCYEPKIVYDVGAMVGNWVLLAKACLPEVTIHAFEPLQGHCEEFEKTVQDISHVTLHKVALGSIPGKYKMQVANRSAASSLLPITRATDYYDIVKDSEEEVTVVNLDKYVIDAQLPLPDLIKLDIQGYELEALNSAINCLHHAKFVICEVSFVELYEGQALFHDLVGFLHQHAMHLSALSVDTPVGQRLLQTDALFVDDKVDF